MNPESDHVLTLEAMEEMHWLLCDYAHDPARDGINGLNLLMALSGVLVETAFQFEQPDEALEGLIERLSHHLNCSWSLAELPSDFMPAPYILDDEAEKGRDVARHILAQTVDEPHAFANVVVTLTRQHLLALETLNIPREESFRVLIEFAQRAMVLEVAAQELCDVLLDHKAGRDNWSLGDCIAALSGVAGYKVGVGYEVADPALPRARLKAQSQTFDKIVDVMTREAVRYGITGGTDWAFGMPANDLPSNPPAHLVSGIQPFCEGFFRAVKAFDPLFQATACAKAAGRMLAVASGGDMPELSPVISKPLALSAMNESYRALL